MRIVFMGSPAFALPSLQALIDGEHQVVAVYTQPDRRSGRGRKQQPPPVKMLALEHGIDVQQPSNFRTPAVIETLSSFAPDVIVVAAFGQILPRSVLAVPKRGILNVHASLLPRWRGASPISQAILAGDSETGITIMEIVPALDAGPIVSQRAVPILDEDTTGTLSWRLAETGAQLLLDTLPGWYDGSITPQPQDDALATYAPQIKKEDGLIDWNEPAVQIWRRVRAFNPWPVAHTLLLTGDQLRILSARPVTGAWTEVPGTVLPAPASTPDGGFLITTGEGAIQPLVVQRSGRNPVGAVEFLRGQREFLGTRLQSAQ